MYYTPSFAQKLDVDSVHTLYAVKPMSYQFQVVEYMKDDKVMKVELQVQATTHDQQGNILTSSGFVPVPRVSIPFIDHK
jgi:hypothetical protein